jgi:hypothetical protein
MTSLREPMWHPVWEPLWKAVNEVALPLHFHTFPTLPPDKVVAVVSSFQMNLANIHRRRHRRRRAGALGHSRGG